MARKRQSLGIIATSIMIVISLIGCNTSQFSSYSADIGDSMLIYIEKFPSDMKKKHTGVITVYYNYWDFSYDYYMDNDSMTYGDEFETFEKCKITKNKKQITITKKHQTKSKTDALKVLKISHAHIALQFLGGVGNF